MGDRDLDVVVFGASSVTGRRVCAYLAERAAQGGARWAAAGRDAARVERVLREEGCSAPETLSADVDDPAALRAMAARARTVVNLVGPYTRYGEPVIAACVEGGASYVDLTGEIPFARRMIDRFDAPARERGVKVVQTCGFESLPPDLAVCLAAETARERFGEEPSEVELEVSVTELPPGMPRPSDWMSGGTLQSMAAIAGDEDAGRLADPALLVTDEGLAARVRARSPIRVGPRRGRSGSVLAPMTPAAFINPAVIHRSAALAAARDGRRAEPFRYREGVAIPGPAAALPLRYAAAGAVAGLQLGIGAVGRAAPKWRARLSQGLSRALPDSGFGPAAERLDRWGWRMDVIATTPAGGEVGVRVEAEGHPGYLATARMMGEAGLMLAADGLTPAGSGCLTPAIALGTGELDRFERARLRFALA